MEKDAKIYVAGHRGLVGSAIWKNLQQKGYTNLVGRTHAELDLLDGVAVREFFDAEKPDYVILAAAFVGGIMANSIYRADFIWRNLQIQQNVIGESFRHNVKKLLFLGSTCIYPREAPQPIPENALLTSPLEWTNEPYALAKIAGLKMCESFNLQYGTNYIAVMPTNLYGPNDNFDLVSSHVLPAMIRKLHLARLRMEGDREGIRRDLDRRPVGDVDGKAADEAIDAMLDKYGILNGSLNLWGSGRPIREFLWSEDMADASVYVMEHIDFDQLKGDNPEVRNCHINIGSGREATIAQVAEMVKNAVGFKGEIHWDSSKPDGTMRKLTDVSKLHALGWRHKVELEDGIPALYKRAAENDTLSAARLFISQPIVNGRHTCQSYTATCQTEQACWQFHNTGKPGYSQESPAERRQPVPTNGSPPSVSRRDAPANPCSCQAPRHSALPHRSSPLHGYRQATFSP